ncbi:MAG: response regulator [Planctomycetes bacterium]|nr:response regulator [Planctomycetota bacterium]
MRVLVIDDSRTMRAILGKMLKELGFEVLEAGDGREGLERLQKDGRPNLVLVDWNLPTMNGLEFIRAVRSRREYDGLPLLMVTTETERSQVAKALEAGATEYVMKPFTRDILLDKLNLLGISPPPA